MTRTPEEQTSHTPGRSSQGRFPSLCWGETNSKRAGFEVLLDHQCGHRLTEGQHYD